MRYPLILIICVLTLLTNCSGDEPPGPAGEPCNATPPEAPAQGESFFFSAELVQSGGSISLTVTDGCNPKFFLERFTFPSSTSGYYSVGMNEEDSNGDEVRRLEIGTVVDDVEDSQTVFEGFAEGKHNVTSRPGTPGFFLLIHLGEELRLTSSQDDQNPGFFRVNERSPIQQKDGKSWFDIKADFEMAVRLEITGTTDRLRGSVSQRVFLP